jgi:hypothetical protein
MFLRLIYGKHISKFYLAITSNYSLARLHQTSVIRAKASQKEKFSTTIVHYFNGLNNLLKKL